MATFSYEFQWDPIKAKANVSKHGVDFASAATVFIDPLALTIPNEEHSETEVRWITMGRDSSGRYVLVIHTFESVTDDRGRIRLISARRPTASEIRSYEEER